MEGIELDVGGSAFPVQISLEAPSEDGGGNGRSHAVKLLIGGLVEMAVAGGIIFQTASALPKPLLTTYAAISLVLTVLEIALLVLLCVSGRGESLTRFAKRGAVAAMVLVLLLALILRAYMAF